MIENDLILRELNKKKKKLIKKRRRRKNDILRNEIEKRAALINLTSNMDPTMSNNDKEIELNAEYREIAERQNIRALSYFNLPEKSKNSPPSPAISENSSEDNTSHSSVDSEAESKTGPSLTRKQQKKILSGKVAQLKMMVSRPDLVEPWDVSAYDPLYLIHLKSYRGTVEVPRHWNQKKKFLQSKRGASKRAYRLPLYIENTGISKIRDPLSEISSLKMIKQKIKERMNPRLGKIEIDYQVLYDAFFKYQSKPELTEFGDIYYEGKEEEQGLRCYRPGKLSKELMAALGMEENSNFPWLFALHKYGPPPSYPNLKIKGFDVSNNEKSDKASFYISDENFVWGAFKEESDEKETIHIVNRSDRSKAEFPEEQQH